MCVLSHLNEKWFLKLVSIMFPTFNKGLNLKYYRYFHSVSRLTLSNDLQIMRYYTKQKAHTFTVWMSERRSWRFFQPQFSISILFFNLFRHLWAAVACSHRNNVSKEKRKRKGPHMLEPHPITQMFTSGKNMHIFCASYSTFESTVKSASASGGVWARRANNCKIAMYESGWSQ